MPRAVVHDLDFELVVGQSMSTTSTESANVELIAMLDGVDAGFGDARS